jgi:rhamnosyltransferase subunit B
VHIIISTIGTYGDVYPYIAVGQVLAKRGHEVQLLTSAFFREHVEKAGLSFISVLSVEDYLAAVRDPDNGHPWRGLRAGWRHLLPAMSAGYDELIRHARPGETVLLGSSMAFWVRLAQEKFSYPAATMHLSPSFLFSAEDPAEFALFPWLGSLPTAAVDFALNQIERFIADPIMAPGLNALRASVGLPPIRHIARRWAHSPDLVIGAFPAWFVRPASDWPPNTVCTGIPKSISDDGIELNPALCEFLNAGAPPIAITSGSGMPHAREFFARALEACHVLHKRLVLVTAFRDQLPENIPDFAFHAAYAPFDLLAPRVAAFVHPAGIGTIGLLLAAGTAQLLTPFANDQSDNAARTVRLGAGLKLKPAASVAHWVKALSVLLESSAIKRACAGLSRRIADSPPAAEAIADLVEGLKGRLA